MDWVFPALAGFALGLLSSYLILLVQRRWQAQQDQAYANNILRNLLLEIEEGLRRAKEMVRQLDQGQASMGRIYAELWRSTNERLATVLSDVETLAVLHRIYYRFDLINFNCERNEPGAGAAFAREYMVEMETNYCLLAAVVDYRSRLQEAAGFLTSASS